MALTFFPHAPWHWIATGIALLLVLVMLAGVVLGKGHVLGSKSVRRGLVLLTSWVALTCLAAALWNPVMVDVRPPGAAHVVILLDVSDSVRRAPGGWPALLDRIRPIIANSIRRLPVEYLTDATATVLTFGDGVVDSVPPVPLGELLAALSRLDGNNLARPTATDLGRALMYAGRSIQDSGGRGAIVLASDGNDTAGEAETAVRGLEHAGFPVYVFPVDGGLPPLAVSAASLPERGIEGASATLRLIIFNQSGTDAAAAINVAFNRGLDPAATGRFGPSLGFDAPVPLVLPDGRYISQPLTMTLAGSGLQYMDVELLTPEGELLHTRRNFIYVERPVEVLAVSGDNRWVAAVPPDRVRITSVTVAQLGAIEPSRYDAVVLSSVPAEELPTPQQVRLASAVREDGLGLLVINGDHAGASEELPTVLRSYFGQPLDAILPVSTEPRPVTEEPPVRSIIIVIDTSGSMYSPYWKIEKATEIARYIIQNLTTYNDYADVIVMEVPTPVVQNMRMTDAGKEQLLPLLTPGTLPQGGSGLCMAMGMLVQRELTQCGLIVISDGEISDCGYRPDCSTTVFGVNQSLPPGSPLYDLAFPVEVANSSWNPESIEVPYFKAEERDKFFEPGTFDALSNETGYLRSAPLPVPPLSLDGAAITYLRDGSEMFGVRPKFVDPLLVFGEAGNGYVGVFTAGFSNAWLNDPAGGAAIEAWLLRTTPFAARDRYAFQVSDDGQTLELTIEIQNEDGSLPEVQALTAHVQIADDQYPVTVEPAINAPATFSGSVRLPREAVAQPAALVLTETGVDAVARPQRVPLLVPPAGAVSILGNDEALSTGLNRPLLDEIALRTAGQVIKDNTSIDLFRSATDVVVNREFWPQLLVLGALLYSAAIALRRTDPEP